MKYIIIVPDGMADEPLSALNGKTPLEKARTPYMDACAAHGVTGTVWNIPRGMKPGSDVANMSILGLNPRRYHTGRGPLEALSEGIPAGPRDTVFRMNFVTIRSNRMVDFTGHHIPTSEAKKLVRLLNRSTFSPGLDMQFYPGVSYRNLLVIRNTPRWKKDYIPPHDITEENIEPYLPDPDDPVGKIMEQARQILSDKKKNPTKANSVWIWGQGWVSSMPSFRKRFGMDAGLITAVDLLKGIARGCEMDVLKVPGATGWYDTNYAGKASCALKSLRSKDLLFIHIEAPDEAGHEGNIRQKIRAIEKVDQEILGRILKGLKGRDFRILLLPDHRTPISIRTHTSDPVPFFIYDSTKKIESSQTGFSEALTRERGIKIRRGHLLLKKFITGKI